MLDRDKVWDVLEQVAAKHNMSCSGLALYCGLNSTTFNKSKRRMSNGKPRWPSTCTIAKVLNTLGMSIKQFAEMFPDE